MVSVRKQFAAPLLFSPAHGVFASTTAFVTVVLCLCVCEHACLSPSQAVGRHHAGHVHRREHIQGQLANGPTLLPGEGTRKHRERTSTSLNHLAVHHMHVYPHPATRIHMHRTTDKASGCSRSAACRRARWGGLPPVGVFWLATTRCLPSQVRISIPSTGTR